MVRVAISLFGDVEVRSEHGVTRVPGRKMQALTSLLALAVPGSVSADRLLDEVWGEATLANPLNSLQAHVLNLRRLLGRSTIVRHGSGYSLAVEPEDIDAIHFEHLVDQARRLARDGDLRTAGQAFEAAIALVRGPPLGELRDFAFARNAAVRLEETLVAAHEGLIDAELACGRHVGLVARLDALVLEHPFHERFHAQLMVALYRSGRQADALRAYRQARARLIDELGVEPGAHLRAVEQAVLDQDPALDLQDRDRPRIPVDAVRTDTSFVGRTDELAVLFGDLSEALAGRLRVALLAGEPGAGKTRLADEVAGEAAGRGALVARGRCYAGRGTPGFWPWTQVIQAAVAAEPAAAREALDRDGTALTAIVPELVSARGAAASHVVADPDTARFILAGAVGRVVMAVAAARPVVVVLDDVQWADVGSLHALVLLADNGYDLPIFVMATVRDVGTGTAVELTSTLADLARRPAVRGLDVRGLDASAVQELVRRSGTRLDDAASERLFRRTQGNPFFLTETLRLRRADGSLDLTSIPGGVREVVRQRLADLPPATVDVLRTAAVLGVDFDVAILARSVGADVPQVLAVIAPAVEAGFVDDVPTPAAGWRFGHELVRDTIYEQLGAAERPVLHSRAATAIADHHADADGSHLLAIAEHWFQAVPAAPAERIVGAALRASQWTERSAAHDGQTGDLLQSALAVLATLPNGPRSRRARARRPPPAQRARRALLGLPRPGGGARVCPHAGAVRVAVRGRAGWCRRCGTWRRSTSSATTSSRRSPSPMS